MEATEITKVIDGVYKNILDNFNPASRQMINTGKAYLKSLHGASAASSLYLDTLVRLSRQAQQSTLGNSGDIGTSLIQITEVFKEIHAHQLNTLKAFYVDFLVPLETNLEKDTRVIQTEQKKFLMCHKQRMETYNKAASTVKKMRKKSKKSNPSATTLDKEIKVMQNLEEERSKLEAFCDKSIREALTQERRRYGFILERQASLAKHYLAFYSKGNSLLNVKLENWMKVAKTREVLPESMQNSLLKRIQGGDEEECIYCSPRRPGVGNSADDTASISSQLRKTKSMDAAEIINLQSEQAELPVTSGAGTMSRAKSELNLMMNGGGSGSGSGGNGAGAGTGFSPHDTLDGAGNPAIVARPKSLAVATEATNNGFAKALYAYLSSGENQLSFLEGDMIGLIGDRNKGWQFGENLRTQKTGWFPVAYTEMDLSTPTLDMMTKAATLSVSSTANGNSGATPTAAEALQGPPPAPVVVPLPPSVISMNNMNNQQSMAQNRMMGNFSHGHGTYSPTSSSNSSSSTFHQKRLNLADVIVHRTPETMMSQPTTPSAITNKSITSPVTPLGPSGGNVNSNNNLIVPGGQSRGQASSGTRHVNGSTAACASDSLHSSNDSGFSNDLTNSGGRGNVPPPQPDIDYSDDEPQLANRRKVVETSEGEKTPPQSGDKWLMDRYHMSESIRIGGLGIGGITRRRSLSFSNVSGVGVGNQMRSSTRGPLEYGNQASPYAGRYRNPHDRSLDANAPGYRRHDPHHQDSGPLKKFLNRTKSLIWRRQALDRIDSISAMGSTGSLELWGSHASLIDANYEVFEMADLSSKDNNFGDNEMTKDEKIQHEDENETREGVISPILMPHNKRMSAGAVGSKQSSKLVNSAKAVPPPLPPFPANLRGLNGLNVKSHKNMNNKATSTTNSLNNLSFTHSQSPSPLDGDNMDASTIGPRDNDSCIFISDHMKQKGSQRSGRKSTKSSIVTDRHSKKTQASLLDDDDYQRTDRSLSRSKKGTSNRKHVSRVESFSGSEAPIVPVQMSNGQRENSKKKGLSSHDSQVAQGRSHSHGNHTSTASSRKKHNNNLSRSSSSNKTHMGKVNHPSNDDDGPDDLAEVNGNRNIGSMPLSRSYIMAQAQEKSRKFSYNSDEDDAEVDVEEYDVDEDVIDFDDDENDTYVDNDHDIDNTSSVFMEPEPEDDQEDESVAVAVVGDAKGPQSLPPMQYHPSVHTTNQSSQTKNSTVSGNGHYGSSSSNSNGNGNSKPNSSKNQTRNGNGQQTSNGNGNYNHSNRFAPIVAYNGNGSGNGKGNGVNSNSTSNGKGRGRSSSPLPQPPSASSGKSNGRSEQQHQSNRHHANGNDHRNGTKVRANGTTSSRQSGSRPATIKGSIRSEFHTVQLIATTAEAGGNGGDRPVYDYGAQIHRRLYFPERNSRLDQKSERSGNLCGPWYDLWEDDASVPCK